MKMKAYIDGFSISYNILLWKYGYFTKSNKIMAILVLDRVACVIFSLLKSDFLISCLVALYLSMSTIVGYRCICVL